MSYEEIHLHLHLSPKRHLFAVISENNKHIEKYINLQDVERRLVMRILKKIYKMFLDTYFFLIVIFIIIVVSV